MKFRTEVEIKTQPLKIEHTDSVLAIGSCFAENIGSYFSNYKFSSLVNPYGVLYNSASILSSLKLSIENHVLTKDDLIYDQEEWHSFYHHSNFSHHNFEVVLDNLDNTTKSVRSFVKDVDWVLVSLGTSFVYKHNKKGIIVSNCHKLPQNNFEKLFLDVDANKNNLQQLIDLIRKQKPDAKFIFTVSPIRHWKDGANENQLSKSSLHLAVNNIVNNNDNVFYFPSYEIVLDELRDYRFYGKDLLHPSDEAVEYIWEKFSQNYLSGECISVIKKLEKIINASNHKIRNPHSATTKKFAEKNIELITELSKIYTHINLENEMDVFTSYLNKQKDRV